MNREQHCATEVTKKNIKSSNSDFLFRLFQGLLVGEKNLGKTYTSTVIWCDGCEDKNQSFVLMSHKIEKEILISPHSIR